MSCHTLVACISFQSWGLFYLGYFANNSSSVETLPYFIPLLAIKSQQIFAHDTTAQLSCHVQNFVVITVLESRSE